MGNKFITMILKRFLLLLLLIPILYLFFSMNQGSNFTDKISLLPGNSTSEANLITPTLYPFQDITIPYLRTQDFSSTLNKRELASENATYSTYLTSYDSEGLQVNALLTVPVGEMPSGGWPAIIFIHGYIPPRQYNPFEKYTDYVDYLARNGFAVFKIDLRGHGYSEGEAGGGYYSADYVKDTLSAYRALQGTDIINPDKIGLWGHSMAGNIVMRTATIETDIPAVVIWAGAVYTYTDLQKYRISDSSYVPPDPNSPTRSRRQKMVEQVGEPNQNSRFWQEFAPSNFVSELKGAVQIHHATNDDVVDVGYSRDLNALLDKTTVPHEYYEYTTGGHNISGPSFVEAMEKSVQFYKTYLN